MGTIINHLTDLEMAGVLDCEPGTVKAWRRREDWPEKSSDEQRILAYLMGCNGVGEAEQMFNKWRLGDDGAINPGVVMERLRRRRAAIPDPDLTFAKLHRVVEWWSQQPEPFRSAVLGDVDQGLEKAYADVLRDLAARYDKGGIRGGAE